MNQFQATSMIQRLTDGQLVKEIKQPSGLAPLPLLLGELQRRQSIRAQASMVQQANQPPPIVTPDLTAGAPTTNAVPYRNGGRVGYARGGIVQHYDDGGSVGDDDLFTPGVDQQGAPVAPAAPGVPAVALGPMGFPTGSDFATNALANSKAFMAANGIPNGPINFQQAEDQAAPYVPDRISPIAGQVIQPAQDALAQYQNASKGRTLMQMGLAMMGSHSPTFLGALAEGAQAGLTTSDQIAATKRQMTSQIGQMKMQQALAQQQHDQALATTATTMQSRSDMLSRYAMQDGIRGTEYGQTAAIAAAQAAAKADELKQTLASQQGIAQVEANSRLGAAGIEANAHITAAQIAASPKMAKIKDPDLLVQSTYKDAYDRASSAKTAGGMPQYTSSADISAAAQSATTAALQYQANAGNPYAAAAIAKLQSAGQGIGAPPKSNPKTKAQLSAIFGD